MSSRWSAVNRVVGTRAGQVLLVALVSTAIGGVFSLSMAADMGWRLSLKQSLSQFWAWGLLVPLIVAIDRRLPFDSREIGRRIWAHFLGSLFITALYLYVFFVIQAVLGVEKWSSLRPSQMFSLARLGWFVWSLVIYSAIVGAVQAIRYYQQYLSSELRLERMERSLAEARLNALRMQLDPHFLFNALNTISSHVERNPKLTRRMIEHLGDLLRMSLECKDRQEVPLSEEMAFLDHYLEIQRIRFGSHLQVRLQIDPAVRFASVPSLMLQPLVENAIRHGISRRGGGGTVTVMAKTDGARLSITVLDDGVGLPDGWSLDTCDGLGLAVTRERIAGLYPNGNSSFAVHPRPQGGTAVEIDLPLRVLGEEASEHAAD
ncbi:MAG TPA: histidine kinase [Terracidiphilus sp.]|jgi:signal transduction histidine kinase|nr:histidine kinase [Terracidiphilus sp.]